MWNAGAATVQLQEWLALGDPGCRVVVHLGVTPGATPAHTGHHYAAEAGQPGSGRTR